MPVAALLLVVTAATVDAKAVKNMAPACLLMTPGEAAQVLSGPASVAASGPAKGGYSDCAWSTGGHGTLATLLLWSADHFPAGGPSASAHFDVVSGRLKERGAPPMALPGLGERAAIANEGAADLEAYTIVVLNGGAVIQLSSRGVPRAAAIGIARAATARLGGAGAAPGADIPVPRPNPFDPQPMAETAPPPVQAAPSPTPQPTEPAPAAAPLPPAPPTSSPATPALPDAKPSSAASSPALRGSPACLLLTAHDLAAVKKKTEMTDDGPGSEGESSCNWSAPDGTLALDATLLEGPAITQTAANAAIYFAGLRQAGGDQETEALDNIGQQATLSASGEGDKAMLAFAIRANEKILFLTIAGMERPAAIILAKAAAQRM